MSNQPSKDGHDFIRWFGPLLDVLRDLGGSARTREAIDAVALRMSVSDVDRQLTLKSGAERFANQVQWARQYLVWEGLLESGRRGVWALTPVGASTQLDLLQAREIYRKHAYRFGKTRVREEVAQSVESEDASQAAVLGRPADSPQSDSDSELEQFLAVLRQLSPAGFERLCLRLLREVGFEKLEVTGRANDGGIDGEGVLQVNDLISFTVVFQCKKWAASVPPKEIRDLRGAMAGRAEKAVFLTTSFFSVNARAEADRAGAAPIELVDGERLFEMFQKYELGLMPRVVYDIDHSFFDTFK
ncbi:MAG: restriction endonuclease [Comamonadaceae bacterium]|nr:MAG: restriction endonuclease [Comamonadaceae bacterium]